MDLPEEGDEDEEEEREEEVELEEVCEHPGDPRDEHDTCNT